MKEDRHFINRVRPENEWTVFVVHFHLQSVHFSLYLYKGTCELSFSLSIIACASPCNFLVGPYSLLLVFLALKVHKFQKEIRGGLPDLVWTWGCPQPSSPSAFAPAFPHSGAGGARQESLFSVRRGLALQGTGAMSFPSHRCVHLCTWETGSLGKTAKGRLTRVHGFTIFFDRTILGEKLFFKAKQFLFFLKHGLYLVFHIHIILQIHL